MWVVCKVFFLKVSGGNWWKGWCLRCKVLTTLHDVMLTAARVPQFSLFNHWPVVFFKSCLSNSSSIFFYMHMGMRQSLPVNWKIMRNSSQRSFLQKLSGRCSGVLPSPIPPQILQYYNRQCHDVIRGPTPVQTPIPQTENPGSWNCATNDWLVLLCGLSSQPSSISTPMNHLGNRWWRVWDGRRQLRARGSVLMPVKSQGLLPSTS